MDAVRELSLLHERRPERQAARRTPPALTANVGGRAREWDAEIVEQIPDERIAWRSLAGTPNDGVVRFQPLSGLDEPPLTRVTLTMVYDPNDWLAAAGEALGLVNRRAHSNLDDFKRFIEDSARETGAWRGVIAG
jgi:uncharacterized membrane protein